MTLIIEGSFSDICGAMYCVICGQLCSHVGSLRNDFQLKELCCMCYSIFYDSTFTYRCYWCKDKGKGDGFL